MNDNREVQVYLFFNGRCEEAVEFYRTAIGAQVQMILKHNQSPEPPPPGMLAPGFENKVMHSSFQVGRTIVMASDGCGPDALKFNGFSLSLSVSTEEEARRTFNALAEGGKVNMPLTKTFWSPLFGMLEDKFGVGWMINIPAPGQG